MTRPRIWDGYPFLLSAAFGYMDEPITCFVDGYDDAGVSFDQGQLVASYSDQVIDFNIASIWDTTGNTVSDASYFLVYIKNDEGDVVTDVLRIDVATACKNPIMLIGRNSLGGVLQWLFDYSQDYEPSFDDDVKAKRLIMYDNTLSQNQFYALQDFITLGAVYRNPIVEFTSTTNKTTTRNGQQVYVVGTDLSKIGVVVIVTKNKTQTKAINNSFEIEIEYPIEFAP